MLSFSEMLLWNLENENGDTPLVEAVYGSSAASLEIILSVPQPQVGPTFLEPTKMLVWSGVLC